MFSLYSQTMLETIQRTYQETKQPAARRLHWIHRNRQRTIEVALAIKHLTARQAPSTAYQASVDQVSSTLPAYWKKFFNQLITLTGTQALVRSGSPNSSLSADDKASTVPICRAKAISDSSNFPLEKETLKFKVSEARIKSKHSHVLATIWSFSVDCLSMTVNFALQRNSSFSPSSSRLESLSKQLNTAQWTYATYMAKSMSFCLLSSFRSCRKVI